MLPCGEGRGVRANRNSCRCPQESSILQPEQGLKGRSQECSAPGKVCVSALSFTQVILKSQISHTLQGLLCFIFSKSKLAVWSCDSDDGSSVVTASRKERLGGRGRSGGHQPSILNLNRIFFLPMICCGCCC